MNEDISSRQEWYEEECQPDIPPPFTFKNFTLSISQSTAALQAFGNSIHSSMVQSNYTLTPYSPRPVPNFDDWKFESVRDRALRLKQQPHWQAQNPDDFHFDRRGRRRY